MNNSAFMENLRQLFAECDTDNNGSLGRDEFSTLCAKIGLNKEAASETFDRLDIDKNNRITFDEFAAGFNQYKSSSSTPSTTTTTTTPSASLQPNKQPISSSQAADQHHKTPPMSPQPPARQSAPRNQKLSPSPVASRARKSASPLGVLSLGSGGGSSGNLRSSSSTNTGDANSSISLDYNSSGDCGGPIIGAGNSTSQHDHLGGSAGGINNNNNSNMIVYSSDMINNMDCDQSASGSGQFNSLVSSSGSLNQVRNMQDLLDCVQKLQSENQILTQIFFKDKREREEYISQLGEEFDQQVREVEERANRRAKEELESEKRRLREMMAAERETLQHHYQTIEKMSKVIKSSNGKLNDESESIDKVRSKLEDTYLENRQLKRSLLDTKTDVAMIWKEMEKLKKQYEDKLSSAYEKNNETRSECDHIKQQLTLMKDSNRKLQDASDVITNYITDKVEPVIKNIDDDGGTNNYLSPNNYPSMNSNGGKGSASNSRRGSILSEYLNGNGDNEDNDEDSFEGPFSEQNNKLNNKSKTNVRSNNKFLTTTEEDSTTSCASSTKPPRAPPRVGGTTTSAGSGSTKQSTVKNYTQVEANKNQLENKSPSLNNQSSTNVQSQQQQQQQQQLGNSINNKNQTIESTALQKATFQQLQDNKTKSEQQQQASTRASIKSIGRHFFIGSRTQSDADINSKDTNSLTTDVAVVKSASVDASDEPTVEPADGPSKATYNIILVGDSFVGKSSFAARFMEGSFVQGLISNCSIDFKTKSYKVDGVNYTVNLWDTAGQERFRSITASYFRKADGIILMYDVTDKRSYLNVRNWMSTISDTASENVAVLLIGNKIDLRQTNNKDKCVPTEEGLRLAHEYDIVFLETSVKTGTNLVPSMGKLIRLIAKNNAPAEEDTDRIRLNDKSKVFNCMPKNC